MPKTLLIIGGLLVFAIGFAAGKLALQPAATTPSGGVAALSKEQIDKDWIYPGAGAEGVRYRFHPGSRLLRADPANTNRSLYYHYAAPAPLDKVLAWYDERFSQRLGVAAKDRLKLSAINGDAEWSLAPGNYEYVILTDSADATPETGNIQAATLAVRDTGHSFTVFIRQTQDANRTRVSLIYDSDAR